VLLEKSRKVEEAITLYEAIIAQDFEGSYPYERLAKLYFKRKMYADEVRVLQKAIAIFEKSTRNDARFKLFQFRTRLEKRILTN